MADKHLLLGPKQFDEVQAYLQSFGTKITAYIEDMSGAIICPHCELEMSIVYWPPRTELIEIGYTCDPSGHGHYLSVWSVGCDA